MYVVTQSNTRQIWWQGSKLAPDAPCLLVFICCTVLSHVKRMICLITIGEVAACDFQGSIIEDRAASALLSWVTGCRGSQLPYHEDPPTALWDDLNRGVGN